MGRSAAVKALLFLHLFISCPLIKAAGQPVSPRAFKTLTVANGLPQSFISGLVQDSAGFIWIGTKDGLARYDGRRFKVFRHGPGDTATIANNRITNLFLDSRQQLWIAYETGDIDLLHTRTEALFHFTKDPVYKAAFFALKTGPSIAEDGRGNTWLLCAKGGLFVCNTRRHSLRFFSEAGLGLQHNKIISIAGANGDVLAVTDTALIKIDEHGKLQQVIPYTFAQKHLYNPALPWKNNRVEVRRNGTIIIKAEDRLLVYHPLYRAFTVLALPPGQSGYAASMAQDSGGCIYFGHGKNIYKLSAAGELTLWKREEDHLSLGAVSMLVDRSGVLWVGGNATGIRLFDLRLPRLSGQPYQKSFHEDVLQQVLNVPEAEVKRSFLAGLTPYSFRWTADGAGGLWLMNAGQEAVARPPVYHYFNGHIGLVPWHYTDTASARHIFVNSMAYSRSGRLWGIDFFLRPVYFDTAAGAVTVYPQPFIAPATITPEYAVNNLLIGGEDTFWVSTSLNGLYCYDKRTGSIVHYSAGKAPGALPTNQLMNMVADPADEHILWMGSLGGGLIRFNKTTGRCRVYTTRDGLPNNTVYAIVVSGGLLWCSSNKGIFSFSPATGAIRSYTSEDGLPGDEFNRYHFLKLPDGRLAFGGVDGYTIFNPAALADDMYEPLVALTGISINNAPADFGNPGSPFGQAINSLSQITLPYHQNFLTFEFAALQYNITEKLHYRYRLQGLDDHWIDAGSEASATYTNMAPGSYVLHVNATNTAGKWSRRVKTLRVIIQPPFWKTWWFSGLCLLLTGSVAYFLIRQKIASVRSEEQQKLYFEREASGLKAQALRAQMNPHFIFNCLNSIKALIQEDNRQQAVSYLTAFSKLIRSQLNNAEREITLYEELETCKLYARLEALRFGSKIVCEFKVDKQVDTHALPVPALILQPFVENAIWHGVLPRGGGKISISVATQQDGGIRCAIEDDGIGREASVRNQSATSNTYESKGMKLALSRIHLYNALHHNSSSIEVVDKKDSENKPAGTLVIINFKKMVG